MRLSPENRRGVVAALGTAQTIGWASSYYLPAVLAAPMAAAMGLTPVWIFGAFSMAMVVAAVVGPWAGGRIDRAGGRGVLMLSNLILAAGLALMGAAAGPVVMVAGWVIVGLGMGIGLYEAAFATLARLYGRGARAPITGVTLIAGFASTVGWPLSGMMLATWGWREACIGWAVIHLCLALPLNAMLPGGQIGVQAAREKEEGEEEEANLAQADERPGGAPRKVALGLLAFVFAATWFNSTAMAAHLPGLLQAAGASTATAIAAGALIGPAQVAARLVEFTLLRRIHPLTSARVAAAAHPVAAVCLVVFGGPAAHAFAVIHGAGNGILTIAKGTLPLALFGEAGYGERLGWLNAPARALQAAAPLIFGAALAAWGVGAVWLTAGVGLAATGALLMVRRG